ncbi:hypothetical protein [Arcticibacter sp. MXS-1]|uniref:hypothetical protein n=1 Tax=Arcticibacter sp. MXS-1 TaxID=3341726 RepID=UPI0035A85A92
MNLIEVNDPRQAAEFLKVPLNLYADDPNYIRPLSSDVENVFSKDTNKFYKDGKAVRWILKNEKGQGIGRIAAFVNEETAYSYTQPTGGIGFFECIDNREAAFILFDAAQKWLKKQGMEAMDGPINLGSREKWWGLLTEGFHPPCYCCNYNPPWYQRFFEDYGFNVFFRQYTYLRRVDDPLQPAYHKIADRIFKNSSYSFRNVESKNLDKYVNDFRAVYNKAWVKHEGVDEMSVESAKKLIKGLGPVIDERIAWFAYFKDEPIGFFFAFRSLMSFSLSTRKASRDCLQRPGWLSISISSGAVPCTD